MEESEISSVDIVQEMTSSISVTNEASQEGRAEKDKKDSDDTINKECLTEASPEYSSTNDDESIKENAIGNKEQDTETVPEKKAISDDFLKDENSMMCIEEQTLNSLSEGFLHNIQPELDGFNSSFQELTRNQRVLMETVQQENAKLSENKDLKDLADMVANAKLYYQKLVNIKKDMTQLHEKTTKIKKRALKLQGQKMKENLDKEQHRDHELEQERKLIAQPARRSDKI